MYLWAEDIADESALNLAGPSAGPSLYMISNDTTYEPAKPAAGDSRRRKSSITIQPADENASTLASATHESETSVSYQAGKANDVCRHPHESDLCAEFIGPKSQSQNVRVIVVNRNVENELSSE